MSFTHEKIETNVAWLMVLAILVVSIGGLVEIVPLFFQKSTTTPLNELVKPYDAVRLAGRDIYLREGCYNCHSQMIRPFRFEQQRYGEPSTMAESQFDHPFQWGSKRTGPDLARVGAKYPNLWHYRHLLDPREVSPGSNMPPYAHLAEGRVDFTSSSSKVHAMKSIGVPYTDAEVANAGAD